MSERKKRLFELAKVAREKLGETHSSGTINEFILAQYKQETGAVTFRTFKGWKDAGFKIKKGSKGYPVFSRPISVIKAEKGQEPETDGIKFGIAYLFNEFQIEK